MAHPGDSFEEMLAAVQQRPTLYHRDGTPYTEDTRKDQVLAWGEDFERFPDCIVKQQRTLYGEKLSTVWLGLDYGLFGPPQIFETMLFGWFKQSDVIERYATEAEALAGHKRIWRWSLIPPPLRRLFRNGPF